MQILLNALDIQPLANYAGRSDNYVAFVQPKQLGGRRRFAACILHAVGGAGVRVA